MNERPLSSFSPRDRSLTPHLERWSKRVMEALGRRGGQKVGEFLQKNICVSCGTEPAVRPE
jgi:hypothetical protein